MNESTKRPKKRATKRLSRTRDDDVYRWTGAMSDCHNAPALVGPGKTFCQTCGKPCETHRHY